MLREKAEKHAAAMQAAIGTETISFNAIRSRIYQTWVIRCSSTDELGEHEYLYPDEESIIDLLIGFLEGRKRK